MKRRLYYARNKVRNQNIIFCAVDTETQGLGGDVTFCSYAVPEGSGYFSGSGCIDAWLDQIFFKLPIPCIHYAHFAQYDWRYIFPNLLARKRRGELDDIECSMRTDKDIYQIIVKIGKKKYVMRDSYAVYNAPLRKFCENFSPDHAKLEIDWDKVEFDPENPDHIQYAVRDAEALRICLINYNAAVEELFGVNIGMTFAGTAVKAWQQTLPEDLFINFSKDNASEEFIRDAYYGGIVFLTSNEKHYGCKTYDINSSYPYCMETYPMPYGTPLLVDKYKPDFLGIYDVEIETPDDLIVPIIPSRDNAGNLVWRKGILRTKITNFELEFALKNGHTLHRLHSGLVWQETLSPFHDVIGHCKHIRKAHKDTSFEIVAKYIQNSLYGKFGAKRVRNKLVIGQSNIPEDSQIQIISEEFDNVYSYEEYSEDMPCKPEWAAFITAFARLRIISTVYAIGPELCLYGDTDSLTVKAEADTSRIDCGSSYGQFKFEKEWECFRAIAPKTYAGRLTENPIHKKKAGKWIGAGKGLKETKMTQEKYKELFETGKTEVEYLTLPSLVVALRKGIAPAVPASRVSSSLDNSVNFSVQGGKVRLKWAHGQDTDFSAAEGEAA